MGAQAQRVRGLQAFWRNVMNSNGWKKDEVCLLETIKLWSKTMGKIIDPFIYKGKKHMEQLAGVSMTVQLGRCLTSCVLIDGRRAHFMSDNRRGQVQKTREDETTAGQKTTIKTVASATFAILQHCGLAFLPYSFTK